MSRHLVFADYPEFTPNMTPVEVLKQGSFGGTYYRPIHSQITGKGYKDIHRNYAVLDGIPESLLSSSVYDKSVNKYNVKVGSSLEFWESKGWITKHNPYGWFDWYMQFWLGRRGPDDARQIARWVHTAGPRSRFRRRLINMVRDAQTSYDDYTVSPKIRQTLQHWGYQLTAADIIGIK